MQLLKDKKFLQASLFLIVSLIIFFYQSIFINKIPVPSDILQTYPFFRIENLPVHSGNVGMSDVIFFFDPGYHFNATSLEHGHLPLWNPYWGCGVPNIAGMQTSFFYPLNIIIYLFGLRHGLLFLYFFKLFFAGIFMYLYERKIGIHHEAAIIGSFAFMFAGCNSIALYWPQGNYTFYLPLGMLATELILDAPENINGYLLLSIGSAVAVFGGHPETLFFTTSLLILYFLMRLFQNRGGNNIKKIIVQTTLFVFIAILISAIQWLPFLQYLSLSYTYLARSTEHVRPFLPASALFLTIIPDFFGYFYKIPTSFSSFIFFQVGYTGYIGITMFLFFIAGLFKFAKNTYNSIFIILLVYIGILTFKVPLLHNLIIQFPLFRISNPLTSLYGCSNIFIILIAVFVINEILYKKMHFNSIKYFIIPTLIIITLSVLYSFLLHHFIKEPYFYIGIDIFITLIFSLTTIFILKLNNVKLQFYLLAILIFLQTALPFMNYEAPTKPEYFYPKNNIINFLKNQQPPFRAFPLSLNPLYKDAWTIVGGITKQTLYPLTSDPSLMPAWPYDISMYYGIEDVRILDSLGVKWYELLSLKMTHRDFLNLTNVRYIVLNQNAIISSLSFNLEPLVKDNGFVLYKNLSAFDRAFMVYDYKVADNDNNFLDLTVNNSLQLHNLAIVRNRDMQYSTFKPDILGIPGHSEIKFIRYQPSYIEIKVNTTLPGLCVISNTYFPGWKVYVDKKESKIIRTDFAFDGIFLEKGDHTVVLKYEPLSFVIGLMLTMAGIFSLVLASILWSRNGKYQR